MKKYLTAIVAALLAGMSLSSASGQYLQVNLTGYQDGMGKFTDSLLNGWGFTTVGPELFCIADTATGVATFYHRSGKPASLVITIPAAPGLPPGSTGLPAGVAYNATSDFVISKNGKSAPARLIFDTLDGLICGWNPDVDPNEAIIMVDNSAEVPFPASYTGLLLAKNKDGKNILYAADGGTSPTTSNNRFDMFDGSFHSVGSFTDPNVALEYPGNTAFQVEYEDGKLYTTFGGFTPPFGGVVDIFDTEGNLLTPHHFAANTPGAGPLVNPWAIARAPRNFGEFSNALLIGNVEDGKINAFHPHSGTFLGTLQSPDGTPIVIPGLWDMSFDDAEDEGEHNQLFFTAGPNFVDFSGNGLFGKIVVRGNRNAGHGE